MKKFTLALATLALGVASMQATDYYLIGGFNGWTTSDAACKFTETAEAGVYVLNYEGTLTSGFKMNDGTWSNDDANFGSNGSKLVVGEAYAYAVGGSTGNIMMDASVENPTLTLNINEGTLLVESDNVEEPDYTYGIHGTIFGSTGWETTNMEYNESADVWTVTGECVAGDFGIKQMANGSQTDWIWSVDDDRTIATGIKMNAGFESSSTGGNWACTLTGEYTFQFSVNDMTLIVAAASAWNEISADENATFAIYTIDGVLVKAAANMSDVNNLESGMYIINGGKVMICK